MKDIFAQRLKSARLMAGISMQDLADRLGSRITKQAIGKYEKGLAYPNSENLIALARALEVSLDYFFRPAEIEVELGEPAYRKRCNLSIKELARIRETVQDRVEKTLIAESLFPPRSFLKTCFAGLRRPVVRTMDDVENFALQLRRLWDLGIDPINNLTQLLEDREVIVVLIDADEDFDGLSCWANQTIPVVVSRRVQAGDRLRSNIGHELGHLLLDVNGVDAEKAAQRFASAFLAPREVVINELGPSRNVISMIELGELKQKYGMSMQMWIYRAHDLGIIGGQQFKNWFVTFRKYGYRQEPGTPVQAEEPRRLQRLVYKAVAENLISDAKAAELLDCSIDQLRKTMKGAVVETGS